MKRGRGFGVEADGSSPEEGCRTAARVDRKGMAAMGWTVARGSQQGGQRELWSDGEARGSDGGPRWRPVATIHDELLVEDAVDGDLA
jgi:hypothetical protein